MYFSLLKLVDRSECSFEIPDFDSEKAERRWNQTLTVNQRLELIRHLNAVRWGKEAASRPLDRTRIQILSMEEFNAIKEKEYAEDQAWLAETKRKFFADQRKLARAKPSL